MTLPLPHPYVVSQDGTLDPHAVQTNLEAMARAITTPATGPRIIGGGVKSTAAGESTSSTTYVKLTTADLITTPVATNGLVALWFQAIWQNTVASNGRAAVFVGTNQLKSGSGTGAASIAEATGPAEVNDDGVLFPAGGGALATTGGVGAATEVTTGQAIGVNFNNIPSSPIYIFNLAAGTYDFSVQFKNNAAGTLTAKNRHLWVASYAFS